MRVINRCSKSPFWLEWQVRQGLRWIDKSHLAGLAAICLEDEMPKFPQAAHETEWAKRVRAESHTAYVNGWYAAPTATESPYVLLYIQPIYRPIPSFLWWSTALTLRIIGTLAHEVAHHLVATRGYVFQEGEDTGDEELLADRYAASVLRKATQRWPYRLGRCVLEVLSGWHYAVGSADWRRKKYKSAAEGFYNAWNLDPESQEASYWYWRAKEMSNPE